MEELLRFEKELDKKLEEETKQLLSLGSTQEQINALDEALECFSYPLVVAYYENQELFNEEL